jgi:hypothetical protein
MLEKAPEVNKLPWTRCYKTFGALFNFSVHKLVCLKFCKFLISVKERGSILYKAKGGGVAGITVDF